MQLLEATFLGNSLRTWLFALGAAILTFIVLRFGVIAAVQRLSGLAKQTESRWDDVITGSLRRTSNALFVVVAIFVGARTLSLSDGTNDVLESLTIIALLVQAGLWFGQGIKDWVRVQREEKAGEDAAAVMTMNVIGVAARLVLWSMVLLLILENVGVDVTALVAGLGIGGIAVALAAQNILGDLFASLSIVLDKPFVLGDFLNVGDFLGTVEEIGLKTTRVRSLSGEQLIFANADLLNSRIRNYGRMFVPSWSAFPRSYVSQSSHMGTGCGSTGHTSSHTETSRSCSRPFTTCSARTTTSTWTSSSRSTCRSTRSSKAPRSSSPTRPRLCFFRGRAESWVPSRRRRKDRVAPHPPPIVPTQFLAQFECSWLGRTRHAIPLGRCIICTWALSSAGLECLPYKTISGVSGCQPA
jgi:small-conductance mechanosensitive channel